MVVSADELRTLGALSLFGAQCLSLMKNHHNDYFPCQIEKLRKASTKSFLAVLRTVDCLHGAVDFFGLREDTQAYPIKGN